MSYHIKIITLSISKCCELELCCSVTVVAVAAIVIVAVVVVVAAAAAATSAAAAAAAVTAVAAVIVTYQFENETHFCNLSSTGENCRKERYSFGSFQ